VSQHPEKRNPANRHLYAGEPEQPTDFLLDVRSAGIANTFPEKSPINKGF
jgi:hypothetical protein